MSPDQHPDEPLPSTTAARDTQDRSAFVAAVAALGGPQQTVGALAMAVDASPTGAVPSRVARVERGRALVLVIGCPSRPVPVEPVGDLAVGQWCVVTGLRDGGPGTVEAAMPRRTALVRHAAGARSTAQVLAADVDIVALTAAVDRRVPARLIERLLALVWDSGARPVIVLTKTDLVDSGTVASVRREVAELALGVDVLAVSARTGASADEIAALVPAGSTLALLGSSGAGKSSLANLMLSGGIPAPDPGRPGRPGLLRTGQVRDADARGRHTTTWRELVGVPGGGALVDTPGLRSVGMWTSGDGVDTVFSDVVQLVASCRFADCRHDSEPGCAVTAAVDAGQLSPARLAGWRALQREATWAASRNDARLRSEIRQQWKQRSRDARHRSRP